MSIRDAIDAAEEQEPIIDGRPISEGGVFDNQGRTRREIEFGEQQEQEEQERLNNLGETRNVDAKIGDLELVGDFSNPDVDVLNTRETSWIQNNARNDEH